MTHPLFKLNYCDSLSQSWECNSAWYSLCHNSHLVNEALAVTEFLDNEEYVTDIYVDTTLQVVVKVDVTAE